MSVTGEQRLGRFLGWWGRELRASVPRPLAALLFDDGDALDVTVDGDTLHFSTGRGERLRELGQLSLSDLAEAPDGAVRHAIGRSPASFSAVTLRLGPADCLVPRVDLPISAAGRIGEVLLAEMDRHTPFPAAEVLFDYAVTGSDPELERLKVEMLVARRRNLEALLGRCAEAGLEPARVTCQPLSSGADRDFNLLPEELRRPPARFWPRMVGAAAVLCLCLAAAAGWLWYDRKLAELELSEDRLTELRTRAAGVRRSEGEAEALAATVNGLAQMKAMQPLAVEVLAEVTRVIPDSGWLITFALNGDALSIEGFADDPLSILRRLEASEFFDAASFAAPVRMDPQIGQERFRITATLLPRGEPG